MQRKDMAQYLLDYRKSRELLRSSSSNPQLDRICRKHLATQAAGCAVTALAASMIAQRFERTQNEVTSKMSEIVLETRFRKTKLKRHVLRLWGLLPPVRKLEAEVTGTDVGSAILSVAADEFEKCKVAIKEATDVLQKGLSLLPRTGNIHMTSSDIEKLLKEDLMPFLESVNRNLGEAIAGIRAIKAQVEDQWEHCAASLSKMKSC